MSAQDTDSWDCRAEQQSHHKRCIFAQLLLMGSNDKWKQIMTWFIPVVCWWAILFTDTNKAAAPWLSHHISSTLLHLWLPLPVHYLPTFSYFLPHATYQDPCASHFTQYSKPGILSSQNSYCPHYSWPILLFPLPNTLAHSCPAFPPGNAGPSVVLDTADHGSCELLLHMGTNQCMSAALQ